MGRYKSIALIYGSDSSEWEVSCRSAAFVAANLDKDRYDVYEIFARFGNWELVAEWKKDSGRMEIPKGLRPEVNKDDFSVTLSGGSVRFDFAYIMQHGTPGENGLLQGYLEMVGIPFSTSNAFVSAVIFDKYSCKSYLRDAGIVKLAPDALVGKGWNLEEFSSAVVARLGLPLFVKPTIGGSSYGITKVKRVEDLPTAIEYSFSEGPSVMVEAAISGREFTCAAYKGGKGVCTLPVVEIIPEGEFFDYDAKYNGHSQEVCPAEISERLTSRIQDTSEAIYRWFGCSGLVRMDYILAEEGLYLLEINSVPGMTEASLVPGMVRAAGISMKDFLTDIIENS